MSQTTVWITALFGMSFVGAVYLYVYLRSGEPADANAVKEQLYGIRPWWIALLVVIIVIALATTLTSLPYADTHKLAQTAPDLVVDATAHQWHWVLSETELPVGKDIAFNVRAVDVNHGFGIYDEHNRLLAQTQAMPGYTNVLRYTFEKPGTYRILCLEYCGLAHHAMITSVTVTAPNE